ncbi:MAG: cobalamin biosynthesis protein [Beijerinckiaceae bacterium]|nr:MAG: cobalamin biosynthesis protein [Beijerinckiaceae bacterium]
MDGDEAMIAIGIGCRKGARKEAILSIIAEALARADLAGEKAELFTFDGKKEEAGLAAAAAALKMPLMFLPLDALRAAGSQVVTRSAAAEKAFGIASVAEASALAGCGKGAYLLLPRISGNGVTCAIAKGLDP